MKHITFGDSYRDTLKDLDDVKRTRFYNVTICSKKTNLSYITKVVYNQKKDNYAWLVTLTKDNFILNNKKPNSLKLALDILFTTNVLHPLQIIVNERGNFERIPNQSYDALIMRYKNFKSSILKQKCRGYIENYFKSLEKQINTKRIFTKNIQHDWFYILFFQPFRSYNLPEKSFSLNINRHNYLYKGNLTYTKEEESYNNTYQAIYKGTDIGKSANINITYYLEQDTHLIKNITATHNALNKTRIKIAHIVEKDLSKKESTPSLEENFFNLFS